MQAESGKTRRDAFLEVADIAVTSRYYARNAARLLKPKRRRGAIPLLTHTTELRHPKASSPSPPPGTTRSAWPPATPSRH